VGLIWLFLGVFLVYPLTRIFYDAVTDEAGRITLANFSAFFNDGFYLRALWKSLVLGAATVAASSVIGIAVAFLLVRYDFAGRGLFSYLTLIPIISPPLVGTLGFTFILGRAGSINVLLMDIFDMLKPINFLYGIHGVVLVETLHLFPMITLNVVDALGKIRPRARGGGGERGRPRLEEVPDGHLASHDAGLCRGCPPRLHLDLFRFATPLILGVQDLLAAQAYLNIVQFVDRRIFRMGIVISALMVILAIVFLLVARRWVGLKDYSTLSYSVMGAPAPLRGRPSGRLGLSLLVLLLSFIPYVGVALAACSRGWSLTPLPVAYYPPALRARDRRDAEVRCEQLPLLRTGRRPLHRGGRAHRLDTRPLDYAGRGVLDSLNTLILAVPGTALGIAYIRAFHFDLPGFDRGLTSFWIVMPLILAVRRLPYTVRGAFSSLLLVHRSMEEAAASVGASGARAFRDVTLPLIWKASWWAAFFPS